jgi:ABC-type Fe3+-citrate transport system substrate-binding protein
MKLLCTTKNSLFVVIVCVLALAVAACSKDTDEQNTKTAKITQYVSDHVHDAKVTDVQKHEFEHTARISGLDG